jgi:hypothetical protein
LSVKRCIDLFALVAVVVAGAATPAVAQPSADGWNVFVAPYLMGAAMSGSTTVRGHTADIDATATYIFSNLQFGAMGIVVARKGVWGVGGDAIWMALGTTVGNTDVDVNQGAFAFYGLRQLGPATDATFGLRVNTLQDELTFKGPDVTRSQDQTWVDPIAGISLRTPAGRRVQGRIYTEIGGFGAGSDFTWQVFPTLSLRLADKASLEFGYRWLDIDYAAGDGLDEFRYDMLTQGPVLGFGFRF